MTTSESTIFDVVETALDKLAALGTAEQIRMYFAEAGLVAQPGNSYTCAVAEHLVTAAGSVVEIRVDDEHVTVEDDDNDFHRFDCPEPVRRFIEEFDAHHYPELVSPTHMYCGADKCTSPSLRAVLW